MFFSFLKIKLEKALIDRADAISRNKSFESSLQLLQEELKRAQEQNAKSKEDIQQFVQSIDEQRLIISEI